MRLAAACLWVTTSGMESGRDTPRGVGVEFQRAPKAACGWDGMAMPRLPLISDLHTLSSALPDGNYFHFKAKELEAQ